MNKKELLTKKVSAISLGCDKNKVDLENILGRLCSYGFEILPEPTEADIVIVNTCSFIAPAKEEAINTIFEMLALKRKGIIEKVIVTGCLPQRYLNEMKDSIPEVDRFVLLRENKEICQIIENLYDVEQSKISSKFERILTSSPSYAYLKIADGCNNVCAFCAIPRIRGRYASTPMGDLIDEAKNLASRGVKELILVAQDITRYGEDLYDKNCLIELCDKLCKIKGIEWIRLHYTYPEKVDKELLDYISENPKMCKYIDIPLQHIDDDILKSMRRRVDEQGTRQLIELLKDYPEIKVRSTFIVGYPGEGRKEFKKLCKFLQEARLDYVGFFPYYKEEGTSSFYIKKHVKQVVKNLRLNKVKNIQNNIVSQKAKELLGSTIKVLVDYFDENTGEFVGHSNFLSPTVDFDVKFVDNGNIQLNTFVEVKLFDFDGKSYSGEAL